MSISVPDTAGGQTPIPGLAWYKPAKPKPARRRRRQAPLRTCGQCLERFRSWGEGKICGRCEEDGSRRPPATVGGPDRADLGGPADDGSLHYLATGEPEPGP